MEYLKRLIDIVGKTVLTAREFSNMLCITFTDDTAFIFEADDDVWYVLRNPTINAQRRFGHISPEEYESLKAKERKQADERRKERELKELARLKEKYK